MLDKTELRVALRQLGFSDQLEGVLRHRDRDKDGFLSIDEHKSPRS